MRIISIFIIIIFFIPACIFAQNPELHSFAIDFNQQSIKLFLNTPQQEQIQEITRQIEGLFLTALIIPQDKFWVNLNAQEEQLMLDKRLAFTDAGRILAEADLRLKKDAVALTDPRASETGKIFWQQLYTKVDALGLEKIEIPVANKLWVVPDEAVVFEGEGRTIIVDAKLKVSCESLRPEFPAAGNADIQSYYKLLMQNMIAPILAERVNHAGEYKELRRLFCALIIAQCYKDKLGSNFIETPALFSDIKLENLKPKVNFDPKKIWEEYSTSVKNGEYAFSVDNAQSAGYLSSVIKRRYYFNGGIDFNFKIKWALNKIKVLTQNLEALTEGIVPLPPLAIANASGGNSRTDILAAFMSKGKEFARKH